MFNSVEKKLSVFLMEHTGDFEVNALQMVKAKIPDPERKEQEGAKAKLSADLQALLAEAQKYLKRHYLLVALYHRLCQLNLHIDWLRLRYRAMMDIYAAPNDCLLRASIEYHRFLPLLAVGEMMADNGDAGGDQKRLRLETHQAEIDRVKQHIDDTTHALGMSS